MVIINPELHTGEVRGWERKGGKGRAENNCPTLQDRKLEGTESVGGMHFHLV